MSDWVLIDHNDVIISVEEGDSRYREPKKAPKVMGSLVEETIENTAIYKEAKELILNAQRKQVAYGIEKYPEPLNPNSWDTVETIDHIIDESIDQLHYLVMLRMKLIGEINSPYNKREAMIKYLEDKEKLQGV